MTADGNILASGSSDTAPDDDVPATDRGYPAPGGDAPAAGDDASSFTRLSVFSFNTPRFGARRRSISATVKSSGVSLPFSMHLAMAAGACPS